MKKIICILTIATVLTTSCSVNKVKKSEAYSGVYKEKPLVVLLMPPINRSTNVEAKELFLSTLNMPFAEQGYYVLPPFLTTEILKRESAYDSELFLDNELAKFGEVFGADVVLFTVIHRWDKSSLASNVYVEVEYILKSTKTNQVIFKRKGDITYDASVNTGGSGLAGLAANMLVSAINTGLTKYTDVAKSCNYYTIQDLPKGKYHPECGADTAEYAGPENFKKRLSAQ